MAKPTPEFRSWLARMRAVLESRPDAVRSALEAHMVRTGRLRGDGTEHERTVRETATRDRVVERSETSANTVNAEVHVAAAQRQLDAATAALVAAQAAEAAAQQALAHANGATRGAATAALAAARTAVAGADRRRAAVEAATLKARALRAGPARAGAQARTARVRAAVDVGDPSLRDQAAAALRLAAPGLADAALEAAVDEALRDAGEAAFMARLVARQLAREQPGAVQTADGIRSRAEERLLDIEAEQLVGDEMAARIAAEVDRDGAGNPRIVHPLQRSAEVARIVTDVAGSYGLTNLAHFISRHGAPLHHPDTGQTVVAAASAGGVPELTADDPTTPVVRRSPDDAAARVVTGVAPDHAVPTAGHETLTTLQVRDAAGAVMPDETVQVPHYPSAGWQASSDSSQHASAKAALYMLEEGLAQSERAVRQHPDSAGHPLEVRIGREDVGGVALGAFLDTDGSLGASYKLDDQALAPADRMPAVVAAGRALPPDLLQRRMAHLTKVIGATSARVALMPDEQHGGFTTMTMFTQSFDRPMVVFDQPRTAEIRRAVEVAVAADLAATKVSQLIRAAAANAAAGVVEEFARHLPMEGTVLDDQAAADARAATGPRLLGLLRPAAAASPGAALAATVAGDGAAREVLALLAQWRAGREAGLNRRHDDEQATAALLAARAEAAARAAHEAAGRHAQATAAADGAMARATGHLPPERALAAVTAMRAWTGQRAAAQVALAERQAVSAAADEALRNAETRTVQAPARSLQGLARAQAAQRSADDALAEAEAEKTRVAAIVAASAVPLPLRLEEAQQAADIAVEQRERDARQAGFDQEAAQALHALDLARQALLQARTEADLAAPGAEATLAARRDERDAARNRLSACCAPDDPLLADEAEDAALRARRADMAAALAEGGASLAGGPPDIGEDPAATADVSAALEALVIATAEVLASQGLVARADAAVAGIEERLADTRRALEVVRHGEDAVLAAEQAQEDAAWRLQPGEAAPAYELRMVARLQALGLPAAAGTTTVVQLFEQRLAAIAEEAAAARHRNAAASRDSPAFAARIAAAVYEREQQDVANTREALEAARQRMERALQRP